MSFETNKQLLERPAATDTHYSHRGSPEIPAALENITNSRTLSGSAGEKSVKFPG